MGKDRLAAFSDGVIAIIITIMVLELKMPHGADWATLAGLRPHFLSYVLSFIYLAIYWNNHHHMLHTVTRVDGLILWANSNLLFWLSYMLTDQVLVLVSKIDEYKTLFISHMLAAIGGALLYKYVFARHVSTGEPPHVPEIIAKPAGAIGHAIESAIESAVETVTGRHHHHHHEQPPETGDGRREAGGGKTGDGKPTEDKGAAP